MKTDLHRLSSTQHPHGVGEVRWVIVACLVACTVFSGCAIIPTNFYAPNSRIGVSKKTQQTIIVGATTREDVFLMLGEPTSSYADGSCVWYTWTKVKALWGWMLAFGYGGGGSAGGAGYVETDYVLVIRFDEHGVVTEREFQPQTRFEKY